LRWENWSPNTGGLISSIPAWQVKQAFGVSRFKSVVASGR
jgi:hypothetical protein